MSTPKIGPPGSPGIPAETHEAADAARPTSAKAAHATTDHVAQHAAPKGADARPLQATTLAIAAPHQPERRTFLGGDRGAWAPAVRDAILLAAENRDLGRALLDAFNRGVA
ncbi:MAG: hypothetical protein ACAI38_13575 [Myxococcota bacterium]